MPKDIVNQGRAWASYRTWDMVIDHLAACAATGASDKVRDMCVEGCIGEADAKPFLVYAKDQNLVDPEELLREGVNAKLPERTDRAHVALCAVLSAVFSNNTAERHLQAFRVFSAAPLDVAAMCARELRMHPDQPKDLVLNPEFSTLVSKYAAVA